MMRNPLLAGGTVPVTLQATRSIATISRIANQTLIVLVSFSSQLNHFTQAGMLLHKRFQYTPDY
jgi:hypothetical protein